MKKFLLFVCTIALVGCDDDSNASNESCQKNDQGVCEPATDQPSQENPSNPGSSNEEPTNPGSSTEDPANPGSSTEDPGNNDDPTSPSTDGDDPCANVQCTAGTCNEGVCVTSAMKAFNNDDFCDPETFVDFCDGKKIVYCDTTSGTVIKSSCDDTCVIYQDTVRGRHKQKAGCTDPVNNTTSCNTLNALNTECIYDKSTRINSIFATACQKTTRNTLRWISVDGYYCQGACNAQKTACELVEGECDPFTYQPNCDGSLLRTCFITSNVTAVLRQEFCNGKCTNIDGTALCGRAACTELGDRKSFCGAFDSTTYLDSIDYICATDDDGSMYYVRTGQHDYCENGCNTTDGSCK